MAKRLICLHPHASYHFGEVAAVDDSTAATMLGIRVGQYRCWDLLEDLGPDSKPKEEPKIEAPKQKEEPKPAPEPEATEPAEEPIAEEQKIPAVVEEPKGKRGSK